MTDTWYYIRIEYYFYNWNIEQMENYMIWITKELLSRYKSMLEIIINQHMNYKMLNDVHPIIMNTNWTKKLDYLPNAYISSLPIMNKKTSQIKSYRLSQKNK